MSHFFYESDYEKAMMDFFSSVGWTCSNADSLLREETEALLLDDMRDFLQNSYKDLTPHEIERLIFSFKATGGDTDYLAARAVANLCVNGQTFTPDDTTQPDRLIEYINFREPNKNIFRAVNQFTMIERGRERRPDILLFVNGIPLCIIELKSPTNDQASIHDAWEQIHIRYKRDIPSLMKFCSISCVSDGGSTRLGTPYTPFEHYYAWKKVENEEASTKGLGEFQTLIKGALSTTRLLELVRDFVYFPDIQEGQQREIQIVCRYPQFFAVKKLFANILKHRRESGGNGKGGTYFGATGCGKTYTMLFLARQLLKYSGLAPTILIIVDREDLESQSGKLFETSTDFLGDQAVRTFDSRTDLKNELRVRQTGGVFVTTIQKFCEETGLLTERENIICFSDEAHRSQLNLGPGLSISDGSDGKDAGVHTKYGFAQHLRSALPKATYVGFTGTPIEETVHVFGPIVDKYTMRQAVDDGITVPLKYEARLARVLLDTEKAKEIESFYQACESEGASPESIEKSRTAMSKLEIILGDEERLTRVAKDIAEHYESFDAEHTNSVNKAMIVCSTRPIAYRLLQKLRLLRPQWFVPKRLADESNALRYVRLESLKALPMVNMVATRGNNDPKEMFELLGDKSYRQMLDREFKNPESNFRIAIVVDMWITGFDVPELSILYNDKPLRRHTLIQTISRVNRKSAGKEYGLIVDYVGIRENMKKAMKQYGDDAEEPIVDIDLTHALFLNELSTLKDLLHGFDATDFFGHDPLARLMCLQRAAEFVLTQPKRGEVEFSRLFKVHVKRLKAAFGILQPSGMLSETETDWAHFCMAIQSINDKTSSTTHSVESMNRTVEEMVSQALQCFGVETVLNAEDEEVLFSDSFAEQIDKVPLPHTKFQLLVKSIKKAINAYKGKNKVSAMRFEERLQKLIDDYNTRDKLTFTNEVASQTIKAILDLYQQLRADRDNYRDLGISAEEKAFYDILINQRDEHAFDYPDEHCLELAKKIHLLVADKNTYADWYNNENLKAQLQAELTVLLYQEGYPPEWDDDVFAKVMDQVRNFKNHQK